MEFEKVQVDRRRRLGFGRKNEGWNDLVGMKAGTGRFVKRDQ